MIITAYVYNRFFGGVLQDTFDIDLQQEALTINKDLTGFGTATFSLGLESEIEIWRRVEIFEDNGTIQQKVFVGYVYDITPQVNGWQNILQVECRDEKHFLTTRLVLSTQAFVNQPIQSIASKIVSEYNSNWDSWIVSALADNATITAKVGTSYYDFFNDLTSQLWRQRDVRDGEIVIAPMIWVDKSIWSGFTEIAFLPYGGNVTNIQIKEQRTIANVAIVSDWSSTIVYPSPLPSNISWVVYKSVRGGDLNQIAQTEIENAQASIVNYQTEVAVWSISANVWDKIQLRIEDLSPKYNFTGKVNVIKKTNVYTDALKTDTYEVWETTIKVRTLAGVINQIKQNVSTLQNQ